MHPLNRSRRRLLCTEPLEGRWYLSASAPAVPAPAAPSPPVEVVEIEAADEGSDGDVEVRFRDLPRPVRAAFTSRYPGARSIVAEFGDEGGEPEYDIAAEFRGRVVDVTLSPGGEVVETEHGLAIDELPSAVRDWVRSNFGDAEVAEAVYMTEGDEESYEVRVARPDGDVEVTLRVPGMRAPAAAGSGGGDAYASAAAAGAAAAATRATDPGVDVSAGRSAGAEDAAAEDRSTSAAVEGAPATGETSPPGGGGDAHEADESPAAGVSAAAPGARGWEAARLAPPEQWAWLPEIAAAAGEWKPDGTAALEQLLRELMESVTRLRAAAGTGAASAVFNPAGGIPWPAAAIAALVAGAQVLMLHSKRHKGAPTLVFTGANSGWSWVLGERPGRPQGVPGRADWVAP